MGPRGPFDTHPSEETRPLLREGNDLLVASPRDARSCRGDAAGAEEEEASKNSDAEEGPDDGLLGEYRPGEEEVQPPASARILPEKAEVSA